MHTTHTNTNHTYTHHHQHQPQTHTDTHYRRLHINTHTPSPTTHMRKILNPSTRENHPPSSVHEFEHTRSLSHASSCLQLHMLALQKGYAIRPGCACAVAGCRRFRGLSRALILQQKPGRGHGLVNSTSRGGAQNSITPG